MESVGGVLINLSVALGKKVGAAVLRDKYGHHDLYKQAFDEQEVELSQALNSEGDLLRVIEPKRLSDRQNTVLQHFAILFPLCLSIHAQNWVLICMTHLMHNHVAQKLVAQLLMLTACWRHMIVLLLCMTKASSTFALCSHSCAPNLSNTYFVNDSLWQILLSQWNPCMECHPSWSASLWKCAIQKAYLAVMTTATFVISR